jgi:hypothetical protein
MIIPLITQYNTFNINANVAGSTSAMIRLVAMETQIPFGAGHVTW